MRLTRRLALAVPSLLVTGTWLQPARANERPHIVPFREGDARVSMKAVLVEAFAQICDAAERGEPLPSASSRGLEPGECLGLLEETSRRVAQGERVLVDPGEAGAIEVACRLLVLDAQVRTEDDWGRAEWRRVTMAASRWAGSGVWFVGW